MHHYVRYNSASPPATHDACCAYTHYHECTAPSLCPLPTLFLASTSPCKPTYSQHSGWSVVAERAKQL
eukprot:scaffold19731_cov133-Isochrysis_galbana.AAC.2